VIRRVLKAKWVAALRSGKYKQGRGFLKAKDSEGDWTYCCLGVLCEVAGLKEKFVRETDIDLNRVLFEGSYSATVPEIFGIGDYGILNRSVDGAQSLASLNDIRKFTFDMIADVIEAQY